MEFIKTSRLSDYESEENRWLWAPYIAQGTVSLIAGLGGKGKSFLSMAIAAAVTRGLPLLGDVAHLPPSNVLLKNAENHLRRMIRRRADIVDADTYKIILLDEGEKRLTLLWYSRVPKRSGAAGSRVRDWGLPISERYVGPVGGV